MSITRSQIARQLLAEGGAPRKGFQTGDLAARDDSYGTLSSPVNTPTDDGFAGEENFRETYADQLQTLRDDANEEQMATASARSGRNLIETFGDNFARISPFGMINRFDAKFLKPGRDIENEKLRRNYLINEGIIRSGPFGDEDLEAQGFIGDLSTKAGLDFARSKGYKTVDDMRDEGLGGDNEPMIRRLRAPITEAAEKEEPKGEFDDILKLYGARFADGGEVRQGYGLGSIVKKATRAVKKVAKSPIGKAALFAGLGAYGLGAGPFKGVAGSGFLKNDLMKKLLLKKGEGEFTFGNLNPFTTIAGISALAGGLSKQDEEEEELPKTVRSDQEFQNLINFYGGQRRFAQTGGDIEDAPKEKPSGIMMASNIENDKILENLFEKYLEMGLSPEDAAIKAREEFDRMSKVEEPNKMMASNIENDRILENLFEKYLELGLSPKDAADKAREEFDRMSKIEEPDRMMANEGGLMNLGGNEMDLRGGGFVPLGAKEKADDVPARLSKNEFVFTADAVKAAGGGSVDRGADIMYKTMKNLENKVA